MMEIRYSCCVATLKQGQRLNSIVEGRCLSNVSSARWNPLYLHHKRKVFLGNCAESNRSDLSNDACPANWLSILEFVCRFVVCETRFNMCPYITLSVALVDSYCFSHLLNHPHQLRRVTGVSPCCLRRRSSSPSSFKRWAARHIHFFNQIDIATIVTLLWAAAVHLCTNNHVTRFAFPSPSGAGQI